MVYNIFQTLSNIVKGYSDPYVVVTVRPNDVPQKTKVRKNRM